VSTDANNPLNAIVTELQYIIKGRDPINLDLNDPNLKDKPFNLKEGAEYTTRIKFKVQGFKFQGRALEL
jgi:Rho GDP-dissociation inhibitor